MYIDERNFRRIRRLLEQNDEQHFHSMKELRRQITYCLQENRSHERAGRDVFPWEHTVTAEPTTYGEDDCEDCMILYDLCQLIDSLVTDIIHLEEETVKWREALLVYLPPEDADGLRSDILSDLAGRHTNEDMYELYMRLCGIRQDRMESSEHSDRMWRLKNGIDEETVRF